MSSRAPGRPGPDDPSSATSDAGSQLEVFRRDALCHLPSLFGAALRMTRSRAAAEDLVQDTIMKAWQKWYQYNQGTHCRAWLFRILTNTFINGCRRRRREREILATEKVDRHGSRMFCREAQRRWSDPDRSLAQRTLSPPVEEAILALAPPFRVVVVLSDLEGFSYKEIAEIVDCPIGTVMSRLFRARRALRKNLAEVAAAYGIGPGLEDPLESAA